MCVVSAIELRGHPIVEPDIRSPSCGFRVLASVFLRLALEAVLTNLFVCASWIERAPVALNQQGNSHGRRVVGGACEKEIGKKPRRAWPCFVDCCFAVIEVRLVLLCGLLH